jgi:Na+-transporting NADH:ubiquinone oxidoreductase subunit B
VASVVPMMDSFWGFEAGSIGETSAFACLIGAAILIITGIGSWRIMLAVLLGGITMSAIFNAVGPSLGNEYMQIPVLHQLMLGSFMFGLVFMATDPVTAAQTENGKWIYGFLIGVMAILIRVVNPAYPEGMMLAILFMNVMAPTIDHFVVQSNIKRRLKRAALQTA